MNRKIFLMMIALGAVLIFLFSSFEEKNIETKDIVGSWSFWNCGKPHSDDQYGKDICSRKL